MGAGINGLDVRRPVDPDTMAWERKVRQDKRAAMHRGRAFDVTRHKRRLHRMTVAGTGPNLQG